MKEKFSNRTNKHIKDEDYQNFNYLETGARHGRKNCQKKLGMLLVKRYDRNFVFDGIKLILLSEQYETKDDIDIIMNSINNIYESTNQTSENGVKETIIWFNEILELTENNKISAFVYMCRNELITSCAKKIINRSKMFSELINDFACFYEYMNEDFFSSVLSLYKTQESDFLDHADDVLEVKKCLQTIEKKEFNYKTQLKRKICLWLARSYCAGTHNAKKDFDIAINYYIEANNSTNSLELQNLIISYCYELIKNGNYEIARKYVPYIYSLSDQNIIKRAIDEHDKRKNINRKNVEAMSGDIDTNYKIQRNAEDIHSILKKKYGFTGFMHETTINNLCKILECGKLLARESLTDFEDSANSKVIEITMDEIKKHVRFYYFKMTPTNYHFDQDNPDSMVYMTFNWKLIFEKDAKISNGNAGSNKTNVKKAIDFLKNPGDFMDWDSIFNRESILDEIEKPEIIRKRNAELMIPNSVSIKYIDRIIFKSNEARDKFISKLDKKILSQFRDKIIADKEYFYF